MTASSSAVSRQTQRPPAGSSSRIRRKEKPQEGEVISVGTGSRSDDGKVTPLDVKAGDKILFGKWSGTEVKIDGEDLIIMKASDILGIVGPDPSWPRVRA